MSDEIFKADLGEINMLPRKHSPYFKINLKRNLKVVQDNLGRDITEFSLRCLLKGMRCNKRDTAKLLVFRVEGGEYFAKRWASEQFKLEI